MTYISSLINIVLTIIGILILVWVVFSWTGISPSNSIYRTVYDLTEPLLRPIRNRFGIIGAVDFSPMILMLIIFVLSQILGAVGL